MWTWHQREGAIYTADDVCFAKGYAGCLLGKNNPDMQDVIAVGPIPRGRYTIIAPHDSHEHGPYVLGLQPDLTNNMRGRSGFLIHGDSIHAPGTASKGCIILSKMARMSIWMSHDHHLLVVA